MNLPVPELGADPQDLADWLELSVLAAGRALPLKEVNVSLEIAEDFEPDAIHVEDDIAEAREQAVASAILERAALLEGAYPFSVNAAGSLLSYSDADLGPGGSAYLLCLFLSQSAKGGILRGTVDLDLNPARDLFQVCATIAAAGVAVGPSVSFGFPRPDHTGYHTKLIEVWKEFRDGTPVDAIPPGGSTNLKDGGIDVIAWRREADGLPAIPYVLAQAASGRNWKDKTVKTYVDEFHGFWFSKQPVTRPSPAMFIPFSLPRTTPDTDFEAQLQIQGTVELLKLRLGTVYYRLRIPRHVDEGVTLAKKGVSPIERVDDIGAVLDWVNAAVKLLRQEAAA
jgi:hypothetical protein